MRHFKLISRSLLAFGSCLILIKFAYEANVSKKPFHVSLLRTKIQDGVEKENQISVLNTQNRTKNRNQEIVSTSQRTRMSTTSYPKVEQKIPKPKILTGSSMDNMLLLLANQRASAKKQTNFVVPNVVHYIWLSSGRDLKFHEVLGILSAQKYLKPEIIKLHCDKEPTGKWWSLYKNRLTSLKIVNVDPNIRINGIEPWAIPVKSDMLRLRILQREGGIYLDFDVIAIQTFDDLRKYEFTLGLEYHGNPGRLNNGIIIAAPNARFFKIWLESYKDFTANEWDVHSCAAPYLLAPKYPSLIHVDENRLNYPGGNLLKMIYNRIYNWTNNYAMHLWYRVYSQTNTTILEFSPDNIKTLNSTFGELARRTFYGSPELILGT